MNTRRTSDYSPLRPGSREEKAAIAARREMMRGFAEREVRPTVRRKTWTQRMLKKAGGFKLKAG